MDTFVDYLRELKNKYNVGTVIRSDKYAKDNGILKAIDGQKLEGTLCLEIPESNRYFDGLEEFENKAKEYGITIIFRAEE